MYGDGPMHHVDCATGTQTQLAFGKLPRYSRDGSKVAFNQDDQVFVMNADGSDVHGAIADPSPDAVYSIADWSWDGTRLLVNKVGENRRMQIVDLASGTTSTVSEGTAALGGWYHF